MRISDWSSDVCSSDLPAITLIVRIRSDRGQGQIIGHVIVGTQRGIIHSVVTERFSIRGPIGGARLARRIWRHQCTRFEIIKLRAQKLLLPRRGRTQEDVLPDLRLAAVMPTRSEEHTSELQSLMRISYAVFCLKKKNEYTTQRN